MGTERLGWWSLGAEQALWAVARRVLDGAGAEDSREEILAECGRLIAGRRPGVQAMIGAYLALLRAAAVLRHGGRFERLEPRRQDAFLASLQACPLLPIRVGFWGLRTMIFAAHYGRPGVGAALGYRPVRDGNGRLHV